MPRVRGAFINHNLDSRVNKGKVSCVEAGLIKSHSFPVLNVVVTLARPFPAGDW